VEAVAHYLSCCWERKGAGIESSKAVKEGSGVVGRFKKEGRERELESVGE
jgi:hypothetical protein